MHFPRSEQRCPGRFPPRWISRETVPPKHGPIAIVPSRSRLGELTEKGTGPGSPGGCSCSDASHPLRPSRLGHGSPTGLNWILAAARNHKTIARMGTFPNLQLRLRGQPVRLARDAANGAIGTRAMRGRGRKWGPQDLPAHTGSPSRPHGQPPSRISNGCCRLSTCHLCPFPYPYLPPA